MTIQIPAASEVWFDSVAKVAADIEGIQAVFAGASGGIDSASGRPEIQPMIDEDLLVTPAAVLYAGDWSVVAGNWEQQTHQVQLLIWIEQHPIATSYAEAVAFRQRALNAFPPRAKAYETLPEVSSVLITGGGGIEPRRWPAASPRDFLVVPISLEVEIRRAAQYQPR